jgi:hypothetical protein
MENIKLVFEDLEIWRKAVDFAKEVIDAVHCMKLLLCKKYFTRNVGLMMGKLKNYVYALMRLTRCFQV